MAPPSARDPEVRFTFDGRIIRARTGQTVAGALHAAGVRTLSWSAKFRRARGLRCGTGSCPGCTVAIDGVGGQLACMTEVREGARVRRIRPRWLLLPADTLSSLVPAGFQEARWLRSSRAWNIAAPWIARLAGQGLVPTPSDAAAALPAPRLATRDVDLLVVGGGPRGLAVATGAAGQGRRVLLVERRARLGGRLLEQAGGADSADALAAAARAAGVEILTGAQALGAFSEGVEGVSWGSRLLAVRATTVVLATGTLDREIVLPDGDRPGVMLPAAVARLVLVERVRPGAKAVIVRTPEGEGQARSIAALLRAAGTEIANVCTPDEVRSVVGRTRVSGVRFARGLVACDLVVLCAGERRADELARQAALPQEPHVP